MQGFLFQNKINMQMKKVILALALPMILISACGEQTTQEETSVKTNPYSQEESAVTTSEDGKTVLLVLESNDEMKYNLSELKVKAGQEVTLELRHVGKMPKEAMGHNFVLLAQGVDMAKFAQEAMSAKDTDYVPNDSKDVIAHTKMIGGGEKASVTFKAPAAGSYDFLCSFPGHYAMMKGKFIVE